MQNQSIREITFDAELKTALYANETDVVTQALDSDHELLVLFQESNPTSSSWRDEKRARRLTGLDLENCALG